MGARTDEVDETLRVRWRISVEMLTGGSEEGGLLDFLRDLVLWARCMLRCGIGTVGGVAGGEEGLY